MRRRHVQRIRTRLAPDTVSCERAEDAASTHRRHTAPLICVFSYVQQPDRALWNFNFFTSRLRRSSTAAERVRRGVRRGFAFANLKLGAQVSVIHRRQVCLRGRPRARRHRHRRLPAHTSRWRGGAVITSSPAHSATVLPLPHVLLLNHRRRHHGAARAGRRRQSPPNDSDTTTSPAT